MARAYSLDLRTRIVKTYGFFWDESGDYGKGGKNGLAVGCGSPSLRIRNVVIGSDSG